MKLQQQYKINKNSQNPKSKKLKLFLENQLKKMNAMIWMKLNSGLKMKVVGKQKIQEYA